MGTAPTTELPPGPRLPAVVQAGLMLRYWPRFVTAAHRRYGAIFALRVASMGTVVYLSDSADIKTVFAGDPTVFRAGEANAMLAGLLEESSVLVVDGDVHRDRRRLMLAPFAREAVGRQTAVMAQIAATNIARWPVGAEFPVGPKMSEITLEVILRTVVGASEAARLAALRAVMPRVLNLDPWSTLAIYNPKLQRRRPWRNVRRRLEKADALLYAEIADRRSDPELAARTDVLAMLVRAADDDGRQMSDRELRDQLMTLLAAGHDTTATALSWTLERLTRYPVLLAEAVAAAEASAVGDPAGDEYLDAVCKETLRIRPVVFDVGRKLTAPVELGGYRIPAGVILAPGIGLVHASPTRYDEPDRFDPHRMLSSDPRSAALGPTTWLPFGGGNRRCLGANFAMIEMRVILREVLRRVELSTTTARDEVQRVRGVILEPHRGARIRVRSMRAAAATPATVPPADQCPVR